MARRTSSNGSDGGDTDAEIRSLEGIIYGVQFIRRKRLTLRHLKLLAVVELLCLREKAGCFPSREKIAKHLKLREAEIKGELNDLMAHRLVHEVVPTYGDASKTTYKMGSTGGSIMKRILQR